MDITTIKKRDGRMVGFDRFKIQQAMERAAQAVDPNADLRPFRLIVDHVVRHIEIKYGDETPEVEGVQDLVEQTLMEHGHYEVGKAYILYRAEQAKRRETTPEPVAAQTSLSLVNEDGAQQIVTEQYIRELFTEYAADLEVVDIDQLVERCLAELQDGMRADDLDSALVYAARSNIEFDPEYSRLAARLGVRLLYQEVFGKVERHQLPDAYRQAFADNIKKLVSQGRLAPAMAEFDFDRLTAAMKIERDDLFDYLGFQAIYDRYLLREEAGERKLETPQAYWMRIAMGLSLNEDDREARAIEFYNAMSTFHYLPSTPTMFHSGMTRAQLSSCYLNTIEDNLEHIFKVYGDSSQMSKYSGGVGTDYTNIRATGAWIQKTNVSSQGVIPFLRIANDVTVAINRSGKRRGATCAYLETWHLDIEDFLDLRRNTGDERRRTHDMNTANWVPDLFMKRVNDGGQWTLFSPDEVPELHHIYGSEFEKKYIEYEQKADRGEVKLFKRMAAKDLWRKMITMLFETGHPWITFKDACNVRSPQDHVGVIHNSNLCTEITLNTSAEETAVCNLGSINLGLHMKEGALDEEKMGRTVATAMRMLDNVIDLSFYPTIEGKRANMRHRPVGLGIMGFQDALYLADIDFDSDAMVRFADYSMELISYHAIYNSAMLAKERGAYESFEGSKWDRGIFPIDTLNLLEQERGMPIGVMRTSKMDWNSVRQAVREYGMRNSNTMAIAPTSNLGNISGAYPCIEPIYKNLYVKANLSGDFVVINKYLVADLKKLGLWNQTVLNEIKQNDGSISEVMVIPPRLRAKYKEVFDIDTEWLIKAAAYRGKWIDQSQSLNIFFKGTSGRRLAEMYTLAWHMGLKTTYYLRTVAASSVEKSTVELQTAGAPVAVTAMVEETVVVAEPQPVAAASVPSSVVASQPVAVAAPMAIATAPLVANAVTSLEGAVPSLAPAATAVADEALQKVPKLCILDDPTCESCQ